MTALAVIGLLPEGAAATGEVVLDGTNLLTLPERALNDLRGRRIGMIFQEPMTALNPLMTIGDQVAEVLTRHHGMGRAEALAVARAAAERAGTDESILTGRARIQGHDVALIVGEFRFLGGSIGRDAGARIVTAVRRATRERLPLLAFPASGGTRMQEGTPAFMTMVDISAAVVAHKAAGLPYLAPAPDSSHTFLFYAR